MPGPPRPFLQRSDVRLVALGVAAVLAVYVGFLGVSVDTAGQLVKRYGYYVMLGTFALWVLALAQLWQRRAQGRRLTGLEAIWAGLAIGLLSLIALTSAPFQSQILFDEFVLQSTAFNMHYFRDTETMMRGYDMMGVFLSTDNYLDKRPIFYPFLVSLAHDLTGYRVLNAYLLNALLFPVTLGLGYYLGRLVNGWRGGLLTVLLLGSLPLLGQNATGASMELLNITMLLAVVALAAAYLRQPDAYRLSALVLGTVLLAQTRYESALYIGPVALVILLGFWRTRQITLPWSAVIAPVLLLPYALQHTVISHSPWMWELREDQASRFGLTYLKGNLQGAVQFLTSREPGLANSWPLAGLGVVALAVLAWQARRLRPLGATARPVHTALFLLGWGVLANTALIMFYYWAKFDDPMASRFSLPLNVLFALAVVVLAAQGDRRWPVSWAIMGAMMIFTMGVTTSHSAGHLYAHLGIDEIEWEQRYVAARTPCDRLILTNKSTMPWLLRKTPSILINRARTVRDRLQYQIKRGTYQEILVTQSLRPASRTGDHQMIPGDRLPPEYKLELLVEKRFGTKIDRISRLVAVGDDPNGAKSAATGGP